MRAVRRALLAVATTAVAAAVVRLRGTVETLPKQGGWRELSETDLR